MDDNTVTAVFNAYLFNPVFWHIWDALHNPKIRKILVRGGSAGGKTAGLCDAINLNQLEEIRNCLAIRKHRVHVDTTIKESFEASVDRMEGLEGYFQRMEGELRVATGSLTTYAGMDDPEKVKGLEGYDLVLMNELNQFAVEEWNEVNRRLRGRPNQKILADWNPIIKTHWINEEILGEGEGWTDMPLSLPEYEIPVDQGGVGAFTTLTEGYAFKRINAAGDTLWINVTYRDNFWIVGHPGLTHELGDGTRVAPDGRLYGFVDVHTLANFATMKLKRPNDYRIYGMGEDGLIRTGNELWTSFEEARDSRDLEREPDNLVWISADNNVMPYVTISIWQVVECDEWTEIRQIAEVAAKPPHNKALKATLELDKVLQKIGYKGKIVVCGDPSGKARTTVDDNGRSFFDKIISTLERLGYPVINKVQKSPPQVLLSQDFINDIYDGLIEGWRIVIGTNCRTALEDYNVAKQGPDGKLLKEYKTDPITLKRYEVYGHFSDTKRYVVTTILQAIFATYKKSSRGARITSVSDNETI